MIMNCLVNNFIAFKFLYNMNTLISHFINIIQMHVHNKTNKTSGCNILLNDDISKMDFSTVL